MNGILWMARLASAAALLLIGPAVLSAQQKTPCDPRTFSEMYRCAIDQYREADAELNRVYRSTLAKLPPSSQRRLRAAEQIWIRYRDAHCEFETSKVEGQREYQVVRYHCLTELTEARTALLRKDLEPES